MASEHIAIALVCCAGEVLIAFRSSDKHQGGKWEFPGGKVELGEGALSAAARELQEEVGIVVDSGVRLGQLDYSYPAVDLRFSLFLFEVAEKRFIGVEGQELRWIPLDQLDAVEFPAANRAMIKLLTDYYRRR